MKIFGREGVDFSQLLCVCGVDRGVCGEMDVSVCSVCCSDDRRIA